MNLLRSAFVIGRRDFTATVFSRAFLFFLIGPLFPLLIGGLFGGIGAKVASEADRPTVAVIGSPAEFAALEQARTRVAAALVDEPVIQVRHVMPNGDTALQERRLLSATDRPVIAVLSGGLANPHLIGSVGAHGTTAGQLQLMIAQARQGGAASGALLQVTTTDRSAGSLTSARAITARAGQAAVFFLTLLLAGMVLSQLIEEKSNKIIEVLAAALPIDAIFLGKLFAMLATSVLGILVWTAAGAVAIAAYAQNGLGALPPPAVGWPAFLTLSIIYFAMNYLLLGSVFLSIGAQASTVREVQTLSMPVTMVQVVIFGLAALAIGDPGSPNALAAAAFPLSSPLVMVARAAQTPGLLPHLLAIAWQLLWVALILRIGARLFRRSVLKSGPSGRWWRRSPKPA